MQRHSLLREQEQIGSNTRYMYDFGLRSDCIEANLCLRVMTLPPRFLRRLGPDPHANGASTAALQGCPDVFELDSGDFAIIGEDVTEQARSFLPDTASCGPDERIVRIPRKTLVLAKQDIPNSL